jgi:hypothetical protein
VSVNKYRPHIFVLPEDDANRQLANGFILGVSTRQVQVLPEAGGWELVLESFHSDHVAGMDLHQGRSIVLLIDFDGHRERLEQAKNKIPERLIDRVFILGALGEPEDLRRVNLGSYEKIGSDMATDCREGTDATWGHNLLQHNAGELDRLCKRVGTILFPRG